MQKRYVLLIASLFILQFTKAQQPQKPNAAEIYNQIQKLNFLGSVLYIAAHPDDENTRLISYFSNQMNTRTGYLSLTRGDGGQNLIGTELRELLGVIRTQELLEARKIDGGEQFFTRANDFGYSKVPDETLSIWEKQQVLSDVVWAIRKFRPDVIINRFDSRTPGSTHGHHTTSAMLSLESFDLAANPDAFPEQLSFVKTWQPQRVFFNTSFWFYGGKDKFDKADKSKLYSLQTGVYYKSLGKSNQEIAALSRSRHQSQGFGSTGTRGEETEYMELIKGDPMKDRSNVFESIDTSWNRVKGGKEIGIMLAAIEKNFDFKNPAGSLPALVEAYAYIDETLDDPFWKPIKMEELANIIAACAGLYLEAVAETPDATPGSTVKIKIEAINRSNFPIILESFGVSPVIEAGPKMTTNEWQADKKVMQFRSDNYLQNNIGQSIDIEVKLPTDIEYTQPYWLKDKGTPGMYTVKDQQNIGIPDIIRRFKVEFQLSMNGKLVYFDRNIVYKYNDDVKGEVYEPFDIVPDVTTSIVEKVAIFGKKKTKTIGVKVKAGKEKVSGTLQLELPEGWSVTPKSIPFSFNLKGSEQTVNFEVTAPTDSGEATAKSVAVVDGKRFDQEQVYIRYSHISKQQVLKPAEARFIKPEMKTGDEKIAYIMGAGDEVNKSLTQMGYDVTVIKPEEITKENLAQYDVAITGIRAYNTIKELAVKQPILLDFVKEGKTMIVQYNTLDDFVTKDFAPFPLKISRDRVTEENAEVRFLAPGSRILNHPNKITEKDFQGWKQEQGLYYPSEWDKAFTPVISANDKGESPKNGALLVANYGKGHYIYTGLSFFRELPEGVPGAFRLMANMISIGN